MFCMKSENDVDNTLIFSLLPSAYSKSRTSHFPMVSQ